jgi:hypothetical protein
MICLNAEFRYIPLREAETDPRKTVLTHAIHLDSLSRLRAPWGSESIIYLAEDSRKEIAAGREIAAITIERNCTRRHAEPILRKHSFTHRELLHEWYIAGQSQKLRGSRDALISSSGDFCSFVER